MKRKPRKKPAKPPTLAGRLLTLLEPSKRPPAPVAREIGTIPQFVPRPDHWHDTALLEIERDGEQWHVAVCVLVEWEESDSGKDDCPVAQCDSVAKCDDGIRFLKLTADEQRQAEFDAEQEALCSLAYDPRDEYHPDRDE